jgi:hypothetical protein
MGYALSHTWQARLTQAHVSEYLDHLEQVKYPYDITYIRWSGLGDNAEPEAGICDFVKDWNARYVWPRFIISDQHAPFAALEKKYGDRLPIRRGDWTPYWEDGAGSSARETAMNRASADRMTQAETVWALRAPASWPAAAADAAWKKVLLYTEHTWGAWNSISKPEEPFVKDQWTIKRGYAEEADWLSRKLLAGASPLPAPASVFDVVNTLSWVRTDTVKVPASLSLGGDRVLDAAGVAVPSQRLTGGDLAVLVTDMPPFAVRRYRVVPGTAARPARPVTIVSPSHLSNGLTAVRLDPATGAIVELTGVITKPFVLMVRLFANMLAGHTMLKVFAGFVVTMLSAGGVLAALSIAPLLAGVAVTALEVLVAAIQAWVFALLTCIYLNEAIHLHDH